MMLLSRPGISVYSQAKQSWYSFNSAIIGSCRLGSNLLLINVGRGLSPGPISTSSKSSADVNPYPNLSSPVKSTMDAGNSSSSARRQQTRGDDKRKFSAGRTGRPSLYYPSKLNAH